MKHTFNIIGAILFSTLFYKQDLGLNLSLFSLLTILILAINKKDAFYNKTVIIKSLAYLLSGIAVFFYKSNLSITANVVSFFIFVGSISEHKASIYINWLNGCYTTIAAFFHRLYEQSGTNKNTNSKQRIDYIHWLKIIGIPLVVLIIFISLYKNGNPMFNDLISKIDFSFINLQWILFGLLGYYLFNNISSPIAVEPITTLDLSTENVLQQAKEVSEKKLESEKQLGTVLMSLLNTLITFFLITDVIYVLQQDVTNATELSNQVHSGINALIASIVFAIVIILYFFRSNLNFYKGNATLKRLTYLWIALNVFLVVVIAFKNYQYIHSFGVTYKRIGVNIYLLLSFIGLFTTLAKVHSVKNLWYLFRINLQTAFAVLIVTSLFNWDMIITHYNLNHAKATDIEYLINLSNNNTLLLKSYSDGNAFHLKDRDKINGKYYDYLRTLNDNSWQEMQYDNIKIKE